jgi:hypothetical protein
VVNSFSSYYKNRRDIILTLPIPYPLWWTALLHTARTGRISYSPTQPLPIVVNSFASYYKNRYDIILTQPNPYPLWWTALLHTTRTCMISYSPYPHPHSSSYFENRYDFIPTLIILNVMNNFTPYYKNKCLKWRTTLLQTTRTGMCHVHPNQA